MPRLDYGEPFPALSIPVVGGGMMALPGDLAGSYGVILIYRGSWCPYCNAQLAAFSRALDTLGELGVKVVAFSVDDEETSAALVAKRRLQFPVGHSADAGKVAAATAAYVNDDPHYLQSTGFILAPDATVRLAVYSSGAIGRLVAEDVVGFIRYLAEHPQAR
ncbi:redoxin domain-containing protein [Mycobacterium parmense]|uniref:Peroxiredoxin n=1 Tax=Mycobacterium parmense TaxID=185642 RepID=A0A7I7YXU7_9MYCO|nr:redoxin domain-containing protein [Mycobacterium parmense]MCV7352691.1 peroxiredoxin family protein [Mycobacterium parmense]ORW54609.1 peroxiredoxin [Mycobacterium parmense]BBZ46698.1 peroxiredoxin [Mycobacterium parmense]